MRLVCAVAGRCVQCVKVGPQWGDGVMVASCCCSDLVSSPWSQPSPAELSCYLWHQPGPASPEPQHFHITDLHPSPSTHNHTVISPPAQHHTYFLSLWAISDKDHWVFKWVCWATNDHLGDTSWFRPEEKFESETSSQEEVKFFMVEALNFMVAPMINYILL